ncbi:MAG: Asp23/Gls24 family envelope stress response protein [Rubrobacteraceae bacterium]
MPEPYESPLLTERGNTRVSKKVVSRVVGLACQEVEGVFVGGGSDTRDETQGVSVEVGETEAAVDLDLALAYGVDLIQTTEMLRSLIRERVQNLVGLRVTELNVTVKEIIFPDEDPTEHRTEERDEETAAEEDQHATEDEASAETEVQKEPGTKNSEQREESSSDQEEVQVEGEPLERDEGAELGSGEEEIRKYLLEREEARDREVSDKASSDDRGESKRRGT